MPSSLKLLAAAAAASAGLVFAAPAVAQAAQPISLQIQYDTQLLASESGAPAVLESLQEQAKDACRFKSPVISAPRVDKDCAAQVVVRAVTQIGDPALTEAYLATTHNGVRLLASAD